MNASRFSTQDSQLLFYAVKNGVPRQYVIPIIDEELVEVVPGAIGNDAVTTSATGAIVVFHNIRDELIKEVGRSANNADALKNFLVIYRRYSRYFNADISRVRSPTTFAWLMIDILMKRVSDVRLSEAEKFEQIVRAMETFNMDRFDISFMYMHEFTLANYKTRMARYQEDLASDMVEAQRINNKIQFLENQYNSGRIPDLSERERIASRFRFKPRLISNGKIYPVSETDGTHIFELSQATQYVPIINYMDTNGTPMRRIHSATSGSSSGDIVSYSTSTSMNQIVGRTSNISYDLITNPNNAKVVKPNYIVFTLWLGDPNNEGIPITSSPSNTIISVAYKLGLGTMTIRIDIGHKARTSSLLAATRLTEPAKIAERIRQAFPNLIIEEEDIIIVGYRGGFQLWNTSIKEALLIHQLINDPQFLDYMYLDDRVNPFYKTGIFNLRYISKAVTQQRMMEEVGVKVSLTPSTISTNTRLTIERIVGNGQSAKAEVNYPAGTQYLEIGITKGVNIRTFNLMRDVIRTLIGYHQDIPLSSITELYGDIVGSGNINIQYQVRRGNTSFDYDNYPHILPTDYHTLCSDPRPVIVLGDNERATFTAADGRVYEYPTIDYPPPELIKEYPDIPIIKLRSNDPKNPYVVIKRTNDRSVSLNNQFYPCNRNQPSQVITETEVTNKEPNTIMGYRGEGILHPSVKDTLEIVTTFPVAPSQRYIKMGTVRGYNSFLHCIIYALSPGRMNEGQITDLAITHRIMMARGITIDDTPLHLSVGRQQFFDMDEIEIARLLEGSGYLDPRLFSRIVEEFYNVNVIHFSSKNYGVVPVLQLPRYREFLAYNYKDRRTIIIMSSFGTHHTSSRNYPHCELIGLTNTNLNLEPHYIFPSEMGRSLTNSTLESNRSIQWINDDLDIHRYVNPHSKINYRQYRIRIIGQRIDNFGKAYAVRFQHQLGSGVIVIPPHEPANCPVLESMTPLISMATAIKIFGQPLNYDVLDVGGKLLICGLWYELDIKQEALSNNPDKAYPPASQPQFTFYVCVREARYNEQEIGPANYLRREIAMTKLGIFDRFINLKKTNYLVKTLIKWLYEIAFIRDSRYNPDQFINDAIIMVKSELSDLPSPYDITGFTSQLPEFDNAIDALLWIQSIDSNMVVNDDRGQPRFAIYDDNYRRDIIDEVHNYRKVLDNFSPEELVHGRENISNFYTPWETGSIEGGNTIIRGEDSFREWVEFQRYIDNNQVYSIISNELINQGSPFIFEIKSNQTTVPTYYLIQNVLVDKNAVGKTVGTTVSKTSTVRTLELSRAKAAYIANQWRNNTPRINRINEDITLDVNAIPGHLVVVLKIDRTIEVVPSRSTGTGIMIIDYGKHWGALLPLGLIESR